MLVPRIIPLPPEITLDNWDNRTIYSNVFMPVFKAPYSFYKQIKKNKPETEDKQIHNWYFNGLAEKTWRILYPEISWYIAEKQGYSKLTDEDKTIINIGIMINIEFLRRNMAVEKLLTNNISFQNFNYTDGVWEVYSDKSFLGEECQGWFTKNGMLRLGVYTYE